MDSIKTNADIEGNNGSRGNITQEINIKGIINKLRNLSASFAKLPNKLQIQYQEKKKTASEENNQGSLTMDRQVLHQKPNHNNPSTRMIPTIMPTIVSGIKRAIKVAKESLVYNKKSHISIDSQISTESQLY
ncbi:hypothetical protein O5282_17980 [Escherichia coli]|nr:hypothetical protein [Escherichia coli]